MTGKVDEKSEKLKPDSKDMVWTSHQGENIQKLKVAQAVQDSFFWKDR